MTSEELIKEMDSDCINFLLEIYTSEEIKEWAKQRGIKR